MGTSSIVAVNASFLLSGMIGLQLHFPEGNGSMKNVEASFPFSINPEIETHLLNGNGNYTQISLRTGKSEEIEGYQEVKPLQNLMPPKRPENNCGEFNCDNGHKCVTWEKEDGSMRAKECMQNDGRFSTKTNPSSSKLCPSGQTHSLILDEPQECLEENPPCDILWKYKCVPDGDSPHTCSAKKCQENFVCLELVHCDTFPPCVRMVECHHISEVDHYQG